MRKLALIFVLLVMAIVGGATLAGTIMWIRITELYQGYSGEQFITIAPGAPAGEIRRGLVQAGLVRDELTTEQWLGVLEQAESIGVVQVHFTGGEPLARRDLEPLVERSRALGLYTNLVTSGIPLVRERLSSLADCTLTWT